MAHRLERKLKLMGTRMNSDGTFSPLELVGPPNLDLWDQSYDLFCNAMVMLDVLDLGVLHAYRKLIHGLHASLGSQTGHSFIKATSGLD